MWVPLLLLILARCASTKDVPDKQYPRHILKKIDRCPDVGFFFERHTYINSVDPGACYLCFCHRNQTAACWKRDEKRCNLEGFGQEEGKRRRERRRYEVAKMKDETMNSQHLAHQELRIGGECAKFGIVLTRVRRSSTLSDLLYGDANNAQKVSLVPDQCKPREDIYSNGCPPDDWCVGCTMCTCNDDGKYDCRILSFCNEGVESKSKEQYVKLFESIPSHVKNISPKRTTSKPLKTIRNIVNRTANHQKVYKFQKYVPSHHTHVKVFKTIKMSNTTLGKTNIVPTKKTINENKFLVKNGNNLTLIDPKNYTEQVTRHVLRSLLTQMDTIITHRLRAYADKIKESQLASQLLKENPKVYRGPKGRSSLNIKKKMDKARQSHAKPDVVSWVPRYKRDMTSKINISVSNETRTNNSNFENLPISILFHEATPSNTSNKSLDFTSGNKPSYFSNNTFYRHDGNKDNNGPLLADIEDIVIREHEASKEPVNVVLVESNQFDQTYPATEGTFSVNVSKLNYTPHTHFMQSNEVEQWNFMKIMKPKHVLIDEAKNNKHSTNEINNVHGKKFKFARLDLDTVFNSKKYNLVRFIGEKIGDRLEEEKYQSNAPMTFNAIDLNDLLLKLFNVYTKNNNKTITNPKEKEAAARYLKKLFKKVLKQNSAATHIKSNIINKLCDNFGNCNINQNDSKVLKHNLNILDKETKNVMTSVRIIKVLLDMIEIKDSSNPQHQHYQDDIQKLNAILRNNFYNREILTSIQLSQIEQIKTHTQNFVSAVSRFAAALNNIITVLNKTRQKARLSHKNADINTLKHLLMKYNLVQNSFIKKMHKLLQKFERKTANAKNSGSVESSRDTSDFVTSSKNIIENLIKLRPIAELLTNKIRKKRQARSLDNLEYLLMLMEFLLKKSTPGSAAPPGKVARDVIDVLIEAFKTAPDITPKNNLLQLSEKLPMQESFHTNKKRLESEFNRSETKIEKRGRNVDYIVEEPFERIKTDVKNEMFVAYDDEKESGSINTNDKKNKENESKEDNSESNDKRTSSIEEESDIKTTEETTSTDDGNPFTLIKGDKNIETSNFRRKNLDAVTPTRLPLNVQEIPPTIIEDKPIPVFYNKIEDEVIESALVSSTIPTTRYDVAGDSILTETIAVQKEEVTTESIPIFDFKGDLMELKKRQMKASKKKNKSKEHTKKPNIFISDQDEETAVPAFVQRFLVDDTTKAIKAKNKSKLRDEIESHSIARQTELEWIEENFGQRTSEIKELRAEIRNATKRTTTSTTATPKPFKLITKENISLNSREDTEEVAVHLKKSKGKMNTDNVIQKKEMELLDSLDYGSEKSDVFEESDSRDGNTEEKENDTNYSI